MRGTRSCMRSCKSHTWQNFLDQFFPVPIRFARTEPRAWLYCCRIVERLREVPSATQHCYGTGGRGDLVLSLLRGIAASALSALLLSLPPPLPLRAGLGEPTRASWHALMLRTVSDLACSASTF